MNDEFNLVIYCYEIKLVVAIKRAKVLKHFYAASLKDGRTLKSATGRR